MVLRCNQRPEEELVPWAGQAEQRVSLEQKPASLWVAYIPGPKFRFVPCACGRVVKAADLNPRGAISAWQCSRQGRKFESCHARTIAFAARQQGG